MTNKAFVLCVFFTTFKKIKFFGHLLSVLTQHVHTRLNVLETQWIPPCWHVYVLSSVCFVLDTTYIACILESRRFIWFSEFYRSLFVFVCILYDDDNKAPLWHCRTSLLLAVRLQTHTHTYVVEICTNKRKIWKWRHSINNIFSWLFMIGCGAEKVKLKCNYMKQRKKFFLVLFIFFFSSCSIFHSAVKQKRNYF